MTEFRPEDERRERKRQHDREAIARKRAAMTPEERSEKRRLYDETYREKNRNRRRAYDREYQSRRRSA